MMSRVKHIALGFTLIETLVAILVLTVAIVGPLTIASRGLGAALISKDQTVAFYLAQDAIEYVRYKRDSNRLAGLADSLTGLDSTNGCTASNGCMIDSVSDTVTACGATCTNINYDSSRNIFAYSSGAVTPYVRKVSLVSPVCASGGVPCNNNETSVTVQVTWKDIGGATHTVTLRENLLNWQ
jgi:Tfp pilus assembly protein PilV